MSENAQNTHEGEGNTKASPSQKRHRSWCMTLNNYCEDDIKNMEITLNTIAKDWIIGIEGEQKTPHLQGWFRLKNPSTFSALKKKLPKKIHIAVARGSMKQNIEYCSKEGKVLTNIKIKKTFQERMKEKILEEEYKNIEWKKWQKKILDLIEKKPDRRKIYWFWDSEGNTGKSFLAKYIVITKTVVIADGKKENIFNQVKTAMDEEKEPNIIILDIPRFNMEYVNYGAIEQLKNGCLYSGKYEGGQCIFPIPHVIIFANEKPKYGKMSLDRWEIKEIN